MATRLTSVRLISCLLLTSIGCSGKPGRLHPPGIPSEAGQDAVSKYDADGNGAIDGDELDKVPSLKVTLKRVDKNGDGRITADEINERIDAWRTSQVALTTFMLTVTRDGRPLSGATVTLVPEPFLGPAVKAAKGKTRDSGSTPMEISRDPDESGVHLGFYRIEVSKVDASGKELLPARFNARTELGAEICRDDPNADKLTIDLKGN